ncbi:MAG TPA: bifunctional demethylmenaquinone methyltransferase/2-methoxy-6-polyprenyl-1,4-benzoquinol methylase UbiE [Flavobacteriaceae bacterium]|nr:bifunctional demethylmenaquinone methyltransferase/2-methoxy-6-polyprenyl-1,4-benzoquinol methylase UbiE [Flavobacteriaceae bacterium]
MSQEVKPYKDSQLHKKEQVQQMFDNISAEYDSLNRVISLGRDTRWRKRVIKKVIATNPQNGLDIATGTGDLALSLAENGVPEVTGLDLSEGMLAIARKKAEEKGLDKKITFVAGDSENLSFADNTFDAITVSFGIRNFENLEKGLSEIYRTLKPGGIFVILETAVPEKFPIRQGYFLYTKYILPLIGKLFSKDKVAYTYLSKSASVFPSGEKLNNILKKIGFIDVKNSHQMLGVAIIYSCSK